MIFNVDWCVTVLFYSSYLDYKINKTLDNNDNQLI